MAIGFNLIPSNLRTPGVFIEVDKSKAGSLQGIPFRVLMLGQGAAGAAQAVNTLVRVTSVEDARAKFGNRSMLHHMAAAYFALNQSIELWAVRLADAGGAVAASGSITVTGPATQSGTIFLYLAGYRITVPVVSGDSANTIAAAINAAINAEIYPPITSTVLNNVVTLTAVTPGEVGNSLDVRTNYFVDEVTPAGVSLAIVQLSGGTANPSVTPAITALADEWFNAWLVPYTDVSNLTLIDTELTSRFGPMRPIDGVAFAGRRGTLSDLLTFGAARNSEFLSVIGVPSSPDAPHIWAAELVAWVSQEAQKDAARPYKTLPLNVRAPAPAQRFTQPERNSLLYDGISTFTVDVDGQVRLERIITTYQLNEQGAPDEAFLQVETMYTLSTLRYSFRNRIASKYPRHKLANTGTRVAPGQFVITPKDMLGEVIAWFRDQEDLGLVENFEQFKRDVRVERNPTDPTRLDILLPPDLVNQLFVIAVRLEFRLHAQVGLALAA